MPHAGAQNVKLANISCESRRFCAQIVHLAGAQMWFFQGGGCAAMSNVVCCIVKNGEFVPLLIKDGMQMDIALKRGFVLAHGPGP